MITAKLLREWSACWNDERIAGHLAGRDAVSPRAVARDASISLDDRLWVLCHTLWYLDERAARLFAIETALEVAHLAGDEDDQAQFLGLMNELILIEDLPARLFAIETALEVAHLAGDEDDQAQFLGLMNELILIEDLPEDQRAAARDVARDAAWATARDVAWDAAWATARDVAWDAALATARDVAWDAALAAARDVAWDAARATALAAAWATARDVAWDAAIEKSIARAIEWLGDFADGWEES